MFLTKQDTPPMFSATESMLDNLITDQIFSIKEALASFERDLARVNSGEVSSACSATIKLQLENGVRALKSQLRDVERQRALVRPAMLTLDQMLRLQEHYRPVVPRTLEELEREHEHERLRTTTGQEGLTGKGAPAA